MPVDLKLFGKMLDARTRGSEDSLTRPRTSVLRNPDTGDWNLDGLLPKRIGIGALETGRRSRARTLQIFCTPFRETYRLITENIVRYAGLWGTDPGTRYINSFYFTTASNMAVRMQHRGHFNGYCIIQI